MSGEADASTRPTGMGASAAALPALESFVAVELDFVGRGLFWSAWER